MSNDVQRFLLLLNAQKGIFRPDVNWLLCIIRRVIFVESKRDNGNRFVPRILKQLANFTYCVPNALRRRRD